MFPLPFIPFSLFAFKCFIWCPCLCDHQLFARIACRLITVRYFQKNLKNIFLSSRKIGVEKIIKALRLGRVEREWENNWMCYYNFGFLWAGEPLPFWTSNCNKSIFMLHIKRSEMPWRNWLLGSLYKFSGILKPCVLYYYIKN